MERCVSSQSEEKYLALLQKWKLCGIVRCLWGHRILQAQRFYVTGTKVQRARSIFVKKLVHFRISVKPQHSMPRTGTRAFCVFFLSRGASVVLVPVPRCVQNLSSRKATTCHNFRNTWYRLLSVVYFSVPQPF